MLENEVFEENNNENQGSEKIKIVVLGSLSVGKTSLITRYSSGKFFTNLPPTCGTSFVKKKKLLNGKKYVLNIWDTAGQERYDSLTQLFTNNAQIAILVYSIVDKKSFEDLSKWLQLIKNTNNKSYLSIGIAANKSDLYLKSLISDSKGKEYAKSINAFWKSTSAKMDDQGIDLLVNELLEDYSKNRHLSENNSTIKDCSFSLSENKKENSSRGCCGYNVKKKKKEKYLIQDDKGSVSFYNNSQRNTLFSQTTFNKEENNVDYDDEDY